MEAAGNDYLEIVELLLENGADRNIQDQVSILYVFAVCICMDLAALGCIVSMIEGENS